MKNFRKALSFVLSCLVIFSSFAFAVSAEECNHLYDATIVSPSCAEAGYTLYVCSRCGDNYKDYSKGAPAKGHTYSAWYNVNEATCDNEGHDKRECQVCGTADIRTLPIVDHIDNNNDGGCDFCGTKVDSDTTVAPFDWLVALFNAIIQFFKDIFA